MQARAIVLLSGGLDSVTTMAIAQAEGFRVHALSFEYGQRHAIELVLARRVATKVGADHTVVRLDPALFGGTALVGDQLAVPRGREIDESIPVTYVPARNILFLSHALALAESKDARDIFIGVNALDYSGYPDCRPEFLAAFEQMAALGMKTGVEGSPVKIRAPLVKMTKAEIIQRGVELGVDYAMTSSCYDPDAEGRPCGQCDSCVLRARGFEGAGTPDPLVLKFR
ncbi:MAG: 7-cyano-7-deazaguanine synthase QueC [bacterium]|nr:7-cyano-7-deazaguanine synthase QueC [bacterium]